MGVVTVKVCNGKGWEDVPTSNVAAKFRSAIDHLDVSDDWKLGLESSSGYPRFFSGTPG